MTSTHGLSVLERLPRQTDLRVDAPELLAPLELPQGRADPFTNSGANKVNRRRAVAEGHPPVVGAARTSVPAASPTARPATTPALIVQERWDERPFRSPLAPKAGSPSRAAQQSSPGTEPLHKNGLRCKALDGGICSILPWRQVWLNQWTQLRVASSRSSMPRQVPSRRASPAANGERCKRPLQRRCRLVDAAPVPARRVLWPREPTSRRE